MSNPTVVLRLGWGFDNMISYNNQGRNKEKAFTNLVGILERMNLMQDPKFVSFPLGNAVFHQYE